MHVLPTVYLNHTCMGAHTKHSEVTENQAVAPQVVMVSLCILGAFPEEETPEREAHQSAAMGTKHIPCVSTVSGPAMAEQCQARSPLSGLQCQ